MFVFQCCDDNLGNKNKCPNILYFEQLLGAQAPKIGLKYTISKLMVSNKIRINGYPYTNLGTTGHLQDFHLI